MNLIILSVLTFLSATFTIRASHRRQTWQIYLFKPLTMIFIIALALSSGANPFSFYGVAILFGLVFSMIGDVLLIPEHLFTAGLVGFLLAHLCYLVAFAHSPVAPLLLSALPFLLFIVLFLRVLWHKLGKLKAPVIIYAVVISAMGWQATDRYLAQNDLAHLLAAAGAVLFIASDTILAYDKFKEPFKFARLLVLSSYFLAQWLIALSV
jgi:uncharacterized membrane protein YhhN